MTQQLSFEQDIVKLEAQLLELRKTASDGKIDVAREIDRLISKKDSQLKLLYERLTDWQKVEISRHEVRPHAQDFIDHLIEDYQPLAGDRSFAEDCAIIGGMGFFRGQPCLTIGHEKGRDTKGRVKHNFGMPRPEGFRKARRLIDLASKFRLPVISFVDTAGAYPGPDAEERGQAEAIARSIQACIRCQSPFIAVITGEGGSGGAIAIAAADRLLMLEHAIYSVISPEGCASILWRDSSHRETAAKSLQVTAQSLAKLGLTDDVISEPLGGAHRDPDATFTRVGDSIETHLAELRDLSAEELRSRRWARYLRRPEASDA